MVGGGGIFFHLADPGKRWINDKHEGLIEVYRALAERPNEFIRKCREIEPVREDDPLTESGPRGGKPTNARLRAIFRNICLNEDADQALRYYFVNRTVHGSGRVNYDIPSRLYFSNPTGWNIVATKALEKAAKHIKGTQITCGDYQPLFTEDGEDVWIYADPPYAKNNNLSASSQLYQHVFEIEDHEQLAEVVRNCKHNVCISYDDDSDGMIRSLYKDFDILRAGEWAYCGTTNKKKELGKELLIVNYEPACSEMEAAHVIPSSEAIDGAMTEEEAQECCERIRGQQSTIRQDIHELHKRLGWIALGYPTWEECIEGEFTHSRAKIFQELKAAKVESTIVDSPPPRETGSPAESTIVDSPATQEVGALPETWCREIGRLPEDQWKECWNEVKDEDNLTAKVIREKVDKKLGKDNKTIEEQQAQIEKYLARQHAEWQGDVDSFVAAVNVALTTICNGGESDAKENISIPVDTTESQALPESQHLSWAEAS